MKPLVTLLAITLITGCSAFTGGKASANRNDAAPTADAEGIDRMVNPEPPPKIYALSDDEKAIWSDPSFRARFAESYLAETEIEPRLTKAEGQAMLQILDLMATDQVDQAAALVEAEINPASSAVFDFTKANIHVQREEFDKALLAYEAAVDKHPKYRRAWVGLSQLYFRQGIFDKAVPAFSRVLELGGGSSLTYGLIGIAHSRRGADIAAESSFRMASLLAPDDLRWKIGIAESLLKQKRYPDAIAIFQTLIEEDPTRAEYWSAQAEAYDRTGQAMKAAENLEMVDRLGASTFLSLRKLGDIYATNQIYGLAVNAYLRALDKDPNAKPDLILQAAQFLSRSGEHEATRTLLARIVEVHGERLDTAQRKEVLGLRARLAAVTGASEEEVAILREMVDLDPQDGEAMILLGQHSVRTGKYEEAALYFERAAGLEKFEADAKLRHGELLAKQRKYEAALPYLRRAQDLAPRDNVRDFLAQVERAAKAR